jgi:hypothetical protein
MHDDWGNVSLLVSCGRIAADLFDIRRGVGGWNTSLSWAAVAFTFIASWVIIWLRVKRMEVVA